VKKIVDALQANPKLWASTAVFITNDEGGGYYDSGFEQTLDYFGDGTRIPMLVVSPYSKGVGVVHSYGDHASFLKFVELNWGLSPISYTTRDNLPNPVTTSSQPKERSRSATTAAVRCTVTEPVRMLEAKTVAIPKTAIEITLSAVTNSISVNPRQRRERKSLGMTTPLERMRKGKVENVSGRYL